MLRGPARNLARAMVTPRRPPLSGLRETPDGFRSDRTSGLRSGGPGADHVLGPLHHCAALGGDRQQPDVHRLCRVRSIGAGAGAARAVVAAEPMASLRGVGGHCPGHAKTARPSCRCRAPPSWHPRPWQREQEIQMQVSAEPNRSGIGISNALSWPFLAPARRWRGWRSIGMTFAEPRRASIAGENAGCRADYIDSEAGQVAWTTGGRSTKAPIYGAT